MKEKQNNTNIEPSRTRQPRQVRESDILLAAYDVFSEKGYEKAAVSEVAKKAGVSEATVFKYFVNKQYLLSKVIAQFYTKLIASTKDALVGVKGTENQLRAVISHHISTFFKDIGLCRLLLLEVRPLDSYRYSDVHFLNKAYSEILLHVIQAGIEKGEITTDVSPKTIRDMIFGCLEHAGWRVLSQQKTDIQHEKLIEELLTMTLLKRGSASNTPPSAINKSGSSFSTSVEFTDKLDRLEGLVNRLENHVE